jgi:hypothetical protein
MKVNGEEVGRIEDAGLLATLKVDGLSAVLDAGQLMQIGIDLQIHGLCLFDPVIRIFIRRAETEQHLVGSDTHQGGWFFLWRRAAPIVSPLAGR